jgi:thiol:disulfide interchange protein
MRTLIATLILLTSAVGYAHTASAENPWATTTNGVDLSQPEFLPVDEAYQLAVEVEDGNLLRVYWQIADAYYLYQHRFKFLLEDASGPVELEIDFPQAIDRHDEYFGDVKVHYNSVDIPLRLRRGVDSTSPATLTIGSQGCADAGLCYPPQKQYFSVNFSTGEISSMESAGAAVRTASNPTATATEDPVQQESSTSVLYMMMLAFLGGAILNLMPCVFPILSLKILSFARSSDHDRHIHGWVYSAGVVLSFMAVAALLIVLQQAGNALGWGFQLQSPVFVIALAYLFIAMGLSLSGVVEFGQGVMGMGSGLADKQGKSGSFFTGVLAVIVASPCTAPFMGTALGFAFTQPAYIALAIFFALGAGMASPLLILSYSAGARNVMPKPGPWMETLKQFLAFPLYATAIWLLWVAGRQTGVNTMAIALSGALILALGLWLWQMQGWKRGVAAACIVAALAMGLNVPQQQTGADSASDEPWTEQQLTNLRGDGQAVFVDVTADWCITCIANEQAVLNTDEVTEAFAAHDVAYMIADWTHYSAEIANYLKKYGRNGIPFYILYPADHSQDPIILPQLLTKSVVFDALKVATGGAVGE